MYVILVYDVGEERVGKVCKYLRRYLPRVQNSVFEGDLPESKLEAMKAGLGKLLTDRPRLGPALGPARRQVGGPADPRAAKNSPSPTSSDAVRLTPSRFQSPQLRRRPPVASLPQRRPTTLLPQKRRAKTPTSCDIMTMPASCDLHRSL